MVFAAVGYEQYTPSQVLADSSLYETVKSLEITEAEKDNLSKINFNDFANLKEIILTTVLMDDGSMLDLELPIQSLIIANAVVDLSTFDLDDFDSISIHNSYNVGGKVVDPKVNNEGFLNVDYKLSSAVHGLEPYDNSIDAIAKSIYEETVGSIVATLICYAHVRVCEYAKVMGIEK